MDEEALIEHEYRPLLSVGAQGSTIYALDFYHKIEEDGTFEYKYEANMDEIFPDAFEQDFEVELSGEFELPQEEVKRIGEKLQESDFFDSERSVVGLMGYSRFRSKETLTVNYQDQSKEISWYYHPGAQRGRPRTPIPSYHSNASYPSQEVIHHLYELVKENADLEPEFSL